MVMDGSDARMPLTGHLGELRSCLVKSLLALAAAFALCFAYVEAIFSFLADPLLRLQSPGLILIGTGVPEAFFTKLKVAFIAALFLASPVLLCRPGSSSRPASTSTRGDTPAASFCS